MQRRCCGVLHPPPCGRARGVRRARRAPVRALGPACAQRVRAQCSAQCSARGRAPHPHPSPRRPALLIGLRTSRPPNARPLAIRCDWESRAGRAGPCPRRSRPATVTMRSLRGGAPAGEPGARERRGPSQSARCTRPNAPPTPAARCGSIRKGSPRSRDPSWSHCVSGAASVGERGVVARGEGRHRAAIARSGIGSTCRARRPRGAR